VQLDRLGPRRRRRQQLRERRRGGAHEPAPGEDVERARPLADEVRRRLEPGLPADAAARQEADDGLAEEPRDRIGRVARVCVLGQEADERPAERLVQGGEHERQRGFGDPCAGRQRLDELCKALVLGELADEGVENGTVHDERRNRRFRTESSYRRPSFEGRCLEAASAPADCIDGDVVSEEFGGKSGFGDDRWQSGFPPLPEQEPTTVPPPRPAPWWRRRPDAHGVRRVMPVLLAATAIATAAVRSYEQSRPAVPPPPSPPTPAATAGAGTILRVYGDPTRAALRPERGNAPARRVCVDEIRPLPTSGAWTCHSWVPLDSSSIGRRATNGGGPCTHRVVSDAGGTWNCWTRIAIPPIALHMPYAVPVMFGHLLPASSSTEGSDQRATICRQEGRSSQTHGAWTCVSEQQAPDGWRLVEPLDPGGPCSYRVADEETGVWSCQSATAQDARADSASGG